MNMKTVNIRLSFACLFLVLGISGCGSNTTSAPSSPTAFGNIYKISDNREMPGWTQDPATPLWTGKGTDLHTKIDGGEATYTQYGCLFAMYQNLIGPDPQQCVLVAMDFGTDTNATSMFTSEQQLNSAAVPIPGYDASTAIGAEVLSGITAYAHIKTSYFELQLIGYPDDASAAQVAAKFLDVLKSKTN